ncbi:4Fe-4S binding protein [Robbsia andropogonis]|uniref:4Fe-4S binding protein n=1 Tax=Robbsia andropogonis TaxID=28092 RepID=UPI003D257F1C
MSQAARIGRPRGIAGWPHIAGDWMQRHGRVIRGVQWVVVLAYAVLIIVPAVMPLPPDSARMWNNLTVLSEFVFWGIWWPFVLLSMVMLGRVWCGVLCPEGTLTEFASKFGAGWAIPRWMRWGGWPFVAFGMTTVYGQMVSVYQYPKAVLVVLGGSTVGSMIIGVLYGREKRVWCKYLCPVNGVFTLLARLAPFRFQVNEEAWRHSYKHGEHGHRVIPVNCAPLVPLRQIQSADCHMCGRCSGHRDAISLATRSSSDEVVEQGAKRASAWDTALLLYGMLGIAIGGFHWTVSPLFVQIKISLAGWLINHDIMWPLADNAPWYVFTHYPDQNDVFTWLDGGLVIGYMMATALVYGTALLVVMAAGNGLLGLGVANSKAAMASAVASRAVMPVRGSGWSTRRLHHFAQALIPQAGASVFLGLTATTLTILQHHHVDTRWAGDARAVLLGLANLWSLWLAFQIARRYAASWYALGGAMLSFALALAIADSAWWLMFIRW